jgi:hypothetical protein
MADDAEITGSAVERRVLEAGEFRKGADVYQQPDPAALQMMMSTPGPLMTPPSPAQSQSQVDTSTVGVSD